MGWSPNSATSAYLDTLKLCKHEHERHHEPSTSVEPESSEFLSALAAGTSSQLIVEVSPEASESTIALAAAARQTGGRLVCILPDQKSLAVSRQVVDESGLHDMVEFRVGDPYKLLPTYENIDFSVLDCKSKSYSSGLLKMLDVNPRRSVVVANHLDGAKGLSGDFRCFKEKGGAVRSMKHPIGQGMEVTMIGASNEFGLVEKKGVSTGRTSRRQHPRKSTYWVKNVDEKSGEEHIYRVTKTL